MKYQLCGFVFMLSVVLGQGASLEEAQAALRTALERDFDSLTALYRHLHSNPEISYLEEKTAARMAEELERAGYEVTRKIGGHGVVAVLRNGEGPVVLLRADMDALPIKEQTALPFASRATQVDSQGNEVPVMHACGHDMHMTVLIGAARLLASHRDLFRGTLVFIAQPAEERGGGAKAMLKDGLFTRFPKPNYCLALHVDSVLPPGQIGYVEGYALANVDSMDITIRGLGGHGAYPQDARDPVVLAAQTILALQTIVSREISPLDPAVITVGAVHGGTKHNIIPDEVKLQLTLRSYTDEVRAKLIESIRRITEGLAQTAGLPPDRMPVINLDEKEFTPATFNHPELTRRWVGALRKWLGDASLVEEKPVMGGEDFGMYGRTEDKIPICILWLGSADQSRFRQGKPPSIHSPFYAPDFEPTVKTGVTALVAAVLELAGAK